MKLFFKCGQVQLRPTKGSEGVIWRRPSGHTYLYLNELIIIQTDIWLAGQETQSHHHPKAVSAG